MTSPRDSTAAAAGEGGKGSRPSFSTFWKKTKQVLHVNRVEFVRPAKQSRDAVQSSECKPFPAFAGLIWFVSGVV